MGFFQRLATLIKSNLNDLISRSEDPEKMLNQIVEDMSNQLAEAKKMVALSIADEKRLEKQTAQEPGRGAGFAGTSGLTCILRAQQLELPSAQSVPGSVMIPRVCPGRITLSHNA